MYSLQTRRVRWISTREARILSMVCNKHFYNILFCNCAPHAAYFVRTSQLSLTI